MTVVDPGPLTVAAYTKDSAATDRGSDGLSLSFPLLGLYGETGSLLSVVKKKQRDSASFLGYAEFVGEELGDVLWYLAAVARRGGICLSAIAAATLNSGYSDWDQQDLAVTFEALQPDLIKHDGEPTPAFEGTLLQLAGEVGALLTDHQAGLLEGDKAALATHLVKILKRLVRAADEARTTLEAAAIKNPHKIFDRWPTERTYLAPFDQGSDPDEQLPRHLVMDVFEKVVGGRAYVFQRCSGIFIGDRLTDNAVEPDDYRFHDVFHLAYVALLGWSPVIRALLKLKRKGEPAVDEAQDGAPRHPYRRRRDNLDFRPGPAVEALRRLEGGRTTAGHVEACPRIRGRVRGPRLPPVAVGGGDPPGATQPSASCNCIAEAGSPSTSPIVVCPLRSFQHDPEPVRLGLGSDEPSLGL